LAEAPPASVFRVPIARVCSLVFGTAHYKRVFVLWVVQVGHRRRACHQNGVVRRLR
jgi:hypothetical protein